MIDNERDSMTLSGYFGPEFQLKLLWQILVDTEFSESIIPHLETAYFDDNTHKQFYIVIKDYFDEYRTPPNLPNESIYHAINKFKNENKNNEILNDTLFSVLDKIINWDKSIENGVVRSDADIIKNETLMFVKQQEYRKLASFINGKIKNGDFKSKTSTNEIEDRIKKIYDIGDEEDYGKEVLEDIDSALRKEFREPISTGIKLIDEATGRGLGRGEMAIVLAALGVGKTTILTKIANTAYDDGYNVLQIVFEDTIDQIRRKHYCIWSGVPLMEMDNRIDEVREKIVDYKNQKRNNHLVVKRFSQENTTIPDIRAWMLRHEKKFGFKFDIVVLDYLDCVESHKRTSDRNEAELVVVKSFEAMAGELNIPCWTALQANRGGVDQEWVYASQMGGNIKRAQKTHFLMSVAKTQEQKKNGVANIQILKARFAADGHTFENVVYNNNTMEIRASADDTNNHKGLIGHKVTEEEYQHDVDKLKKIKEKKKEEDENDVKNLEDLKSNFQNSKLNKEIIEKNENNLPL